MKFFREITSLLLILSQAALSSSQCPFSSSRSLTSTLSQSKSSPSVLSALTLTVLGGQTLIENYQQGGGRVKLVNYDEVRTDLRTVMRESQEVGRDINTEIHVSLDPVLS